MKGVVEAVMGEPVGVVAKPHVADIVAVGAGPGSGGPALYCMGSLFQPHLDRQRCKSEGSVIEIEQLVCQRAAFPAEYRVSGPATTIKHEPHRGKRLAENACLKLLQGFCPYLQRSGNFYVAR